MSVTSSTERATAVRPQRGERPRPELSVVPARESQRIRRLSVLVGFAMMFGLLFAAVAFHVHLVQRQQMIDQLDVRAEKEQARYDRLRVTVDQLESPARIAAEASQLGMEQPGDVTWLPPVELEANSTPTTAPAKSAPDEYAAVKPYLGDAR